MVPSSLAMMSKSPVKPKANFQEISACQRLRSQQLFSELRFTEIKAGLMDAQTICCGYHKVLRTKSQSQRKEFKLKENSSLRLK
jgi:hypothetical protein